MYNQGYISSEECNESKKSEIVLDLNKSDKENKITSWYTDAVIEDGAWCYDEPYGVVHRLASNGRVKGVADCCFAWCKGRYHYLRVDTHSDNATMLYAIERQGFVRSGIITLSRNGDKRIAYEWHI